MKNIKIILLERIKKLGNIGDIVYVKPGYARNFLIPKAKAKAATQANIEYFQSKRLELEEKNTNARLQAEQKKQTMHGLEIVLVRASSDKGHLYGSVTARDIASACSTYNIKKDQINIQNPIKTIGIFPILVTLHPEVTVEIFVNIARSHEEAELQKKEKHPLLNKDTPTANEENKNPQES